MNRKHRKLAFQSLEHRRVLAASVGWDGPGLGSAELSYYISGSPVGLSAEETQDAIETALDAWAAVVDITFTPTDRPGLSDSLDFSFGRIDGIGGTLAQAYFPDDVNPQRLAGDIQFDIDEQWEVGNAAGRSAFDLVWVAVHEIGHALGLDHAESSESVLAPTVSPNQAFEGLSDDDIADIQKLYAAKPDSTIDVTPTNDLDNQRDDFPDMPNDWELSNDFGDQDETPFPSTRWFRGGTWMRFGRRLDIFLVYHNYANPLDANFDSRISVLDALLIINRLNPAFNSLAGVNESSALCDTNGDGVVTSIDALRVINSLNQQTKETGTDTSETSDRDEIANDPERNDKESSVEFDGRISNQSFEPKDGSRKMKVDAVTTVRSARQNTFEVRDPNADQNLTKNEFSKRQWNRLAVGDVDQDTRIPFEKWSEGLNGGTHRQVANRIVVPSALIRMVFSGGRKG